jgi:hypothetical protein
MKTHRCLGLALTALLLSSASLRAHCDTLDGPVVTAARQALERRDVTPVLKWVKPDDERPIRAAFSRTLAVRSQSREAAELADTYFFETLVRVHRAGEGAPFTGLKPGPADAAAAAADEALADANAGHLIHATTARVQAALRAKFDEVVERRKTADRTVEDGRAYVAAYVDYVHFVERLNGLAEAPSHADAAHAEANAHPGHAIHAGHD